MIYNIRITEKAEKDIKTIYKYIETEYQTQETATNTVKMILDGIESLETFPFRCPPFRLDDRYRVLFTGSYNVIFEVDGETVTITSVIPSILIH